MPAALKIEAGSHDEFVRAIRGLSIKGVLQETPTTAVVTNDSTKSLEAVRTIIGLLYCGKKKKATELVRQHFHVTDLDALTYVDELFDEFFSGVEVT